MAEKGRGEENPPPKVRKNEKLIAVPWRESGRWRPAMIAIWSGRRRGAWQETGTVIYDVLGGFHLAGGFTQDSGGEPSRLLAVSG